MNRNYAIMGKSYEKKDARDKALGLARFAGEISFVSAMGESPV